jgi:hypothetical protein
MRQARADGLGRASRSKGKSLDGRRHQANALLWVKSRRRGSKWGCPLCPRKAISGEWDGMSALCQQRKSAVHTWRLAPSALGHVWTAPWQGLSDVLQHWSGAVTCPGLLMRQVWPLALMLCADRVPIVRMHLEVRRPKRALPIPGNDRYLHYVVDALANFGKSPCLCCWQRISAP